MFLYSYANHGLECDWDLYLRDALELHELVNLKGSPACDTIHCVDVRSEKQRALVSGNHLMVIHFIFFFISFRSGDRGTDIDSSQRAAVVQQLQRSAPRGHPFHLDPATQRAIEARHDDLEWLLSTCKGFKAKDEWDAIANLIRASDPGRFQNETLADLLADADIRVGDYRRVLQDLKPWEGGARRETLLRISFANAKLGITPEGQRDFCLRWMLTGTDKITDALFLDAENYLPGGTPKAFAFLSALALGVELRSNDQKGAFYFLSIADSLDPGNPVVAWWTIQPFEDVNVPLQVRVTAFERALDACRPGALRDSISYELLSYKNREAQPQPDLAGKPTCLAGPGGSLGLIGLKTLSKACGRFLAIEPPANLPLKNRGQ